MYAYALMHYHLRHSIFPGITHTPKLDCKNKCPEK
jgi:hypothetical protein